MAQLQAGSDPDRGTQDRLRIERLLGRYPRLSAVELDAVRHWFEREASALDVALVASNAEIGPGYAQFKAEHVDRLGFSDMLRAMAFLATFGGAVLAVSWLAA